jgi:cytochrome c oxidase cbb3-type subunit II
MKSSAVILVAGITAVVLTASAMAVFWPAHMLHERPSGQWRPLTPREEKGRQVYIRNGCVYCHSQYVRPQDWGIGAERIAEAGDYYKQSPQLLGTERTGPDLSQEGGEHSNHWHIAHFIDPRYTRPRSLMPRFEFESAVNRKALIAYVQSLGGKNADDRMAVQMRFHMESTPAFLSGPDSNIEWLHSRVPETWRRMPTETSVTKASVARGEKVYQDFCIGCHGPVGDGNGPAAKYVRPTPVNFTILKRHLVDGKYIGGILYYQIMNGITGSDMPYFKKDLESARIWDVGNFIEYSFINHTDDEYPSVGIPAAFEGKYARPVLPLPKPKTGK